MLKLYKTPRAVKELEKNNNFDFTWTIDHCQYNSIYIPLLWVNTDTKLPHRNRNIELNSISATQRWEEGEICLCHNWCRKKSTCMKHIRHLPPNNPRINHKHGLSCFQPSVKRPWISTWSVWGILQQEWSWAVYFTMTKPQISSVIDYIPTQKWQRTTESQLNSIWCVYRKGNGLL